MNKSRCIHTIHSHRPFVVFTEQPGGMGFDRVRRLMFTDVLIHTVHSHLPFVMITAQPGGLGLYQLIHSHLRLFTDGSYILSTRAHTHRDIHTVHSHFSFVLFTAQPSSLGLHGIQLLARADAAATRCGRHRWDSSVARSVFV